MGVINSLAHQWPDQSCCVNDVNGIFTRNGVHHVMHQHGFLSIAHVVSTDLVHWHRVKDAVGGNPWKNGNAWDGSVSLLPEPIGPVIMYDSPPEPSNISLARAADPTDPFLVEWAKAGPLVHGDPWHLDMGGERVDFPSNIWKNADHWNMLINVRVPNVSSHSPHAMNTARFQTTNASLESWKLVDWNFHESVGDGSDSFFPLVKSAPGHDESDADVAKKGSSPPLPQWMLNVHLGEQFAIGSYDPVREKFTPGNVTHTVEYGSMPKHTASATWFATGPSSNNRTITIGWLSGLGGGNQSQLSCVRELTWSPDDETLLSNPVGEYSLLRNSTLASVENLSLAGSHSLVSSGAGSSDLEAEFTVPTKAVEFGLHAFVDASGSGRAVVTVRITVEAEHATGRTAAFRAGWVNASVHGGAAWGGPFRLPSGERQVRLRSLLDRTSVESFVGGGRAVVTAVSTKPSKLQAFGAGVFGTRGVQVTAKLFGMGCGWLDSMPTPPAGII
jgi:sucrose-6-phosphate hydrolase SacC (GH32 family)